MVLSRPFSSQPNYLRAKIGGSDPVRTKFQGWFLSDSTLGYQLLDWLDIPVKTYWTEVDDNKTSLILWQCHLLPSRLLPSRTQPSTLDSAHWKMSFQAFFLSRCFFALCMFHAFFFTLRIADWKRSDWNYQSAMTWKATTTATGRLWLDTVLFFLSFLLWLFETSYRKLIFKKYLMHHARCSWSFWGDDHLPTPKAYLWSPKCGTCSWAGDFFPEEMSHHFGPKFPISQQKSCCFLFWRAAYFFLECGESWEEPSMIFDLR